MSVYKIVVVGAKVSSTGGFGIGFVATIGFLHWPALCAISRAGLIGAPFGVKLATYLPAHIVQRIFALCMIIVGLKMSFNF